MQFWNTNKMHNKEEIWNTVTGMGKKKEESNGKSPGDIELNISKLPYDEAEFDLKLKNEMLDAELDKAQQKADYATSVQDISAIAAAVSQLLSAQKAMAEVQKVQAGITLALKGGKT